MSSPETNITRVARRKKGYNDKKLVRYPTEMKEDIALLAELNDRDANDEWVLAMKDRIAAHREAIDELRRRRR